MNFLKKIFAYLRLTEAIRRADRAYSSSGRRQYVLPAQGRKLIIMDRANFRILKRKGYIPHTASLADAEREAFYFTPHADGSGAITKELSRLKLRQFLFWCSK